MVDTLSSQRLTVGEAAQAVGVEPHTLRRWCGYHAAHLSEGANPAGNGVARRLTWRDVEILRSVRTLRAQGLTVEQVNERLPDVVVGEVVSAQESQPLTPAPLQPSAEVDSALQVRVQLLYDQVQEIKQRQLSVVTAFAAGAILSAIFFLIIVLLVRMGS
jgi:DNA-binding transcriptional MerR regulator